VTVLPQLHSGRNVLVTGGSGGLGAALVRAFAAHGARVVLTYLTEGKVADALVEEVRAGGGAVWAVQANLAEREGLDAIEQVVTGELGSLDVLIANAASGVFKPLSLVTRRDWSWVMEVNAMSIVLLVQRFVAALSTSGGNVLAMSSLGAARAIPQYGLVGASKAALEAVVRQLAAELGPAGVRVNALAPGLMETRVIGVMGVEDEFVSSAGRRTPLGRLVDPDEVAQVAAAVTSHLFAAVSGEVITVDGGFRAVAF
jgi:enoyl-[acyl-carrier protein] reductase III